MYFFCRQAVANYLGIQDEKSSGMVFSDTEMNQALREWQKWIARAMEKGKKNSSEVEKDLQAEKTKQDQQNMLLRMSKKRVFQEGLAILPEFGDSEQDSSRVQTDDENTPRGQTKKQRLEAK